MTKTSDVFSRSGTTLPQRVVTSVHKTAKIRIQTLTLLATERAVLRQTNLAASWLAKNGAAGRADDDSLSMREDGGDVNAARALDVHEEAVGGLHEPLELVLPLLDGGVGMQQVVLKECVGMNCNGHDCNQGVRITGARRRVSSTKGSGKAKMDEQHDSFNLRTGQQENPTAITNGCARNTIEQAAGQESTYWALGGQEKDPNSCHFLA